MDITKLIELRDNLHPLYVKSQAEMLRTKAELELVEQEFRLAKIRALGEAEGKNEAQRNATAQSDREVVLLTSDVLDAQLAFNAAYAEYARHKAAIEYVRDATALLNLTQSS